MIPIIPGKDVDKSSVEQLLSGAFITTHRDSDDDVVVDLLDGNFKVVVGIKPQIIQLVALFRTREATPSLLEALNEFNAHFNFVKAYTSKRGAIQVLTFESYVQTNDGLYPPHFVKMLRAMEEIVMKTPHSLDPFLK